MARKAQIVKAQKQAALINHYRSLRQELKAAGDYEKLRKLPRQSPPNRYVSRDRLDGRSRGVFRQFGLSRINFRRLALAGHLPGIKKASW